jgi:hypothetical protein
LTPYLVTTRFNGNAAYVDLETRNITSLSKIRSVCNNNLFSANGILNVTDLTGVVSATRLRPPKPSCRLP